MHSRLGGGRLEGTLALLKSATPALGVMAYYGLVNLVTLFLYAWDKRAAGRGAHRVRERTLHLWTLAGGFIGALAGQGWLRHKSRHFGFVAIAWSALALHAAAWSWWLSR
jgi:uncharacterized membrane protein YsdA (DUF1294 family)